MPTQALSTSSAHPVRLQRKQTSYSALAHSMSLETSTYPASPTSASFTLQLQQDSAAHSQSTEFLTSQQTSTWQLIFTSAAQWKLLKASQLQAIALRSQGQWASPVQLTSTAHSTSMALQTSRQTSTWQQLLEFLVHSQSHRQQLSPTASQSITR